MKYGLRVLNKADSGKYNQKSIYDSQGRLCILQDLKLFFDAYNVNLDTKLPNGLYYFILTGQGERKYGKIVLTN